jgi:hypothetical protein
MGSNYEKTAPVRFPGYRHEMLWYLHDLASPSVQRDKWILGKPKPSDREMYGLSFVIHFFFDDTELGTHPEKTLGYILLDDLEVSAIRRVVTAFDRVSKEMGDGKPDSEYLASPRWPKVIEAARSAYRLLWPRLKNEGDDILPPEVPF